MRIRITHATAATVYRWATTGKRRRRRKWLHCLAVCRVLNRREAPLMATMVDEYGLVGCIKLPWGFGHARALMRGDRPLREIAMANVGDVYCLGPPWGNTESARVLRGGSR